MNNKETLEETAERYATGKSSSDVFKKAHIRDFMEGAKWQQEQDKDKYSEEYIAEKLFNHPVMDRIRSSKSDAEARRIILQELKKK
jgi:hypothetical protein